MNKASLLGGVAAIQILWSVPALAQEPADVSAPQAPAAADDQAASSTDNDGAGLAEIVVTARRREERLQDVPVSVTAIGGEQLSGAGINKVQDLTQVVPGLYVGRNAAATQPTIRGVGSSGTSVGDEPSSAIYVDGIYQPDLRATSLDFVSIDRVEVLRGPQGTIFGRNATGGLINIITTDPSFNSEGFLAAQGGLVGSHASLVDVRGYLTGPLSDTLAANLSAAYRNTGGYVKNLGTGDDEGGRRVGSVRGKLLWQISDAAKFVMTADYNDIRDEQPTFQPYQGNTAGRSFAGAVVPTRANTISYDVEPLIRSKLLNLSLRGSIDLGSVVIESATGYSNPKSFQRSDSDATNIPLAYVEAEAETKTFSQELRLLSNSDGPFDWLLGVYAFNLSGRQKTTLGAASGLPGATYALTVFDPKLSTRSYAAFAEGTYQISEPLFLTVGGRYTYEKRSFSQTLNGVALPFGKAETSMDRFTYRAALRYEFGPRASVYASYGTGFKSGAYNAVGTTPVVTEPEHITAYEVGLKADPLSWLRTNISAYYYDYTDLQVSARTPSGAFTLQNAANAEVYGAELELTAAVTDELQFTFAPAINSATFVKFPNAQTFTPRPTGGNAVSQTDVAGNTLPRAPKFTASLGARYSRDVGDGKLEISSNLFYSSQIFYDFNNFATQPRYVLLNGEISYAPGDGALRIGLAVENATNSKVFQQLQPGAQSTTAIYREPRQVIASLRFNF